MNDDFLRSELRNALSEHTPDRTAMLNRMAANRAATPSPRGRRLRLAGAAAAVTTVLGLGGVAQWALAGEHEPAPPAAPPPATAPAITSPTPRPSKSSPTPTPSRTSSPSTSPPAATTTEVRGHPGDTQVEKGTLWSDGSVVADGRSRVTLKAKTALTSLDLILRIEPATGLTTGKVNSPDPRVNATLTRDGNALLYRFTLAKGQTLPSGTYVFTATYKGDITDRDAAQDTYEAFADTTVDDENKRLHIYGNYFPTD
ncbi:hypothetical protein [Paractinoplanes atraurantiacus]|uniref:Uncharacterized protein n=1 Tax=Paractinoplanes atraurantiacus TaxID=1036182 RepID=A0A285K1S0_9ACTN|nr:hypothetical protein [Actinoplanes atraurantiacus]SNY66524.1 hypothetical protein SAMN05421748_13058 [Actinoplanes atraurantiacus]